MSSKLAASFSFSVADWCIFMAGRWQKKTLNCPGLQLSIRNGVKVIKELMQENAAAQCLGVFYLLWTRFRSVQGKDGWLWLTSKKSRWSVMRCFPCPLSARWTYCSCSCNQSAVALYFPFHVYIQTCNSSPKHFVTGECMLADFK